MGTNSRDHERSELLTGLRPIYSLMLGTRQFIVLSGDTDIKELLDKRGNIYSDRPEMFIGQKIASGNLRLVLMVSIVACILADGNANNG